MKRFGFDETALADLVVPVLSAAPDRHVAAGREAAPVDPLVVIERVARAAWSMLGEPGDRTAGLLITALGASDALDALLDVSAPAEIAARVDPAAVVERKLLTAEIDQALARWRPRLRSAELVRAFEAAARCGARLLVPDDDLWPVRLDDLGVHGPVALWVRGTDDALARLARSIALVGARAATSYGEQLAMDSSAGLVERGFTIVSGAAYGIDGMAHRAALASGGNTVAFLAGGVDRLYPAGHHDLLGRIAENGAVVAELPCGAEPTKWRFLQRNRLIAAATRATIVLEAGWRSGSLNTANHAAALGRPVGAVPGPVTSAASAGCHRLIRESDARLVTTVDEMVELVGDDQRGDEAERGLRLPAGDALSSEQIRVIDALSTRSARAPEQVARLAGLSAATVIAVLGTLALDGAVMRGPSGWRKA